MRYHNCGQLHFCVVITHKNYCVTYMTYTLSLVKRNQIKLKIKIKRKNDEERQKKNNKVYIPHNNNKIYCKN